MSIGASKSHVGKRFGDFVALDDVSVSIPTGQLTALLGPSGGGKSTLLRIIAGLEHADTGTVDIEGVDATTCSPQKRNVGFVFQHYAAFKHLSVAATSRSAWRSASGRRTRSAARSTSCSSSCTSSSSPTACRRQLSGGQRQRMALARALAVEPTVLLLDEPFGALDAKVRKELRDWLRRLHDEVHVTTVFVTHDQEEALEVADEIVVINDGRVEQIGSPDELYDQPGQRLRHALPRPGHPARRTWCGRTTSSCIAAIPAAAPWGGHADQPGASRSASTSPPPDRPSSSP